MSKHSLAPGFVLQRLDDKGRASSRPGRPPKRSQCMTSSENPHIMPHSVPGLMSPGMIPPTGLTAAAAAAANAAIAEAMKVKKIKLEAMSGYHGNAIHHGMDMENGDLGSSVGLELPFMMMPHPLIPVSLPPASVTMAMNQMNHLSTIANMAAAAQGQSLPSRMVTSVIKVQERVPDSPSPAPSLEDHRRPGSHPSSHRSSSVSSSPAHTESSSDRIPIHHNGMSMNHALLGLSPNIPPGPKEGDLAHDMSHEAKRMHNEKEDNPMCTPTARESYERLSFAGQALPPGFPSPFLFPDGLSSIETLLTNIQLDDVLAHEARKIGMVRDPQNIWSWGTGNFQLCHEERRGGCPARSFFLGSGGPKPGPVPFIATGTGLPLTDSVGFTDSVSEPGLGGGGCTSGSMGGMQGQAEPLNTGLGPSNSRTSSAGETMVRSSWEPQLDTARGSALAAVAATGPQPDTARGSAIIQKRLKKEKKAKRKLQEALEYESKRREQVEQSMKQPSPSDSMRSLNGQNFHNSLTPEMESDRSSGRTDAERTIQDGRLFLKTTVMY
ncbi:dachshund homolog 1-like [Notothenia coriiceps]|uniref:Dachshund homolog 1-like n=1 Tax=Notothenia coriiceps TaxID=8208 RepID=A0A6I9PLA8_9TELE|nr:PREDICTED: dachshund homolog 1-like [Notothenia coriiceps]